MSIQLDKKFNDHIDNCEKCLEAEKTDALFCPIGEALLESCVISELKDADKDLPVPEKKYWKSLVIAIVALAVTYLGLCFN